MTQTEGDSLWFDHAKLEQIGFSPEMSTEESQEFYIKWATAGTYDTVMGKDSKHDKGMNKICSAMISLFPNPEIPRVLDVGAGTGLAGEVLKQHGFVNLDAIEPQAAFIDVCRLKNIYRNIFTAFIRGINSLDIPNDTYDVLVASRAFAGGHIPCSALQEMIRITKPGGYFINLMREEYLWTVPEYNNRLKPLIKQLEDEGQWKQIKWEVFPHHFLDKNGLLMIYQIS